MINTTNPRLRLASTGLHPRAILPGTQRAAVSGEHRPRNRTRLEQPPQCPGHLLARGDGVLWSLSRLRLHAALRRLFETRSAVAGKVF